MTASLIVEAGSMCVLAANAAARSILRGIGPASGSSVITDIVSPETFRDLVSAITACAGTEGETRSFRQCFSIPGGTDIVADVSVVGCHRPEAEQQVVLVELRTVSTEASRSVLSRLIADNPHGDTLLNSLVVGPLAGHSVRRATLCAADHENGSIIQLGTFGLDEDARRSFRVTPLNHMHPGGAAVLDAETVWLSMREVAERFPLVGAAFRDEPWFDSGEVLTVPVVSRGTVVGCLFLLSETAFPRTWEFREKIEAVVQALAPWLLLQRRQELANAGRAPRRTTLGVTDRERTIIRLVGEGRTNSDIAQHLGYSEATVRGDPGRLARMLGTSGRREIARRIEELGL